MLFIRFALATSVILTSASAVAFHPLITDDTGTQGTGGNQLEVTTTSSKSQGATDRNIGLTYARGISDPLDVAVSIGHNNLDAGPSGMGNTSIGLKWRFYENEGSKTSAGIKPNIYLPVSETKETDGLGYGRASPEGTFILTQETDFGAVHANIVVAQDRFRTQDSARRIRYSLAPAWTVNDKLLLALDVGSEQIRQSGITGRENFVELGVVYSVESNLAVSFGVTRNRDNSSVTTNDATLGVTWLFK